MDLATFAARLDDELRTDAFADLDASPNGVQVGPDGPGGADEWPVERVAVAVDAAVATAEEAVAWDADCLLVHHGVVWGGLDRLTGTAYERIAPLVRGDCALYVSHLPLDAHPELGNAAGVADHLGLGDREPFGALGGEHLGVRGRLAPTDPAALRESLADLDNDGVRHLDVGPERVEDVAVLTGSGADWLGEARAAGVDALVTGEGKQQVYHEAREAGVHVYLAGHYATETFGVRALAETCESWGLTTTFIDHPTGL
jgi:dinuclear metal center YbgI/SA1388 family protein